MNGGRRATDGVVEILITEDSPTQAESLRYLLERHHYKVVLATDGREALDWLADHQPAMVITDINMPRLSGYDLCRQIKADKRLRDVPVILLTSLTDTSDVLEGLACGADSFITKPYSEDYLVARVERTLVDAALPHSQHASIRVEIPIPGQSGVITADPQRMVSLLMSSYEAAIFRNTELVRTQDALSTLNEHLEDLVEDRTAVLTAEIAERQRAEVKIRYLAGVLENVSDAIVSLDLQGKIQSWNTGAENLFGFPAQEVLGHSYADLVDYDYLDSTEAEAFREIGATGSWRGEVGSHHQNGSLIYVLVAAAVLKDFRGVVTGFSAVLHDVTDRKRADAAVRLSEARFRALIENSTDAISLIGPDGSLQYGSPSTIRILGYSGEELLGSDPVKLIHADDLPAVLALLADLLQRPGQTAATHYRMQNKAGAWRWIEASISNLLAEPGVGAVVFNYRDVSDRIEAAQALSASELRFRALIENSTDAITLIGADGLVLYDSPAAPGMLGYEPGAWLNQSLFSYLHPDDAAPTRVLLQQLLEQPAGRVRSQVRLRHHDGTWRWIEAVASNLLAEPSVCAIVVNYRDITERETAGAALRESEDKFKYVFDNSLLGKAITRPSGMLTVNKAFSEMMGYSQDELQNHAFLEITHPDDAQMSQAYVDSILAGDTDSAHFTKRYIRKDGTIVWAEVSTALRRDEAGQPLFFMTAVSDITERKQRERELEAMAAVSIALRTADTQAQMLPLVLEQVMALLGATGALLALRDLATDELVIALGLGEVTVTTGLHIPAASGISGRVLATGRPYVSSDLSTDPLHYPIDQLDARRAAVCVPLITSQNVLGVLWAGRASAFSDVEVRVLSAIADIAASAIQRAGLHEQTEVRLHRLTALRNIDSAIMNSLDLSTTLVVILEQVASQLSVDACDILLFNRAMNNLEFAAGRGFWTKGIEATRLQLGAGHAGLAALERRLVTESDLAGHPDRFLRGQVLAAEAFASLFSVPLLAKGQIVGVLEVWSRSPLNPDSDWLGYLETLAGQSAIAVSDAWQFTDLQRSNLEMRQAYDSTLEGWSAALDLRDKETEGHSQRVTEMTLKLATAMGVSDDEREQIRRGALLHDIGKMGVPDAILFKPGKLTDEEWGVMRQHPNNAYKLLSPIAYLQRALAVPYCHHEKWDGTGYPRQLKGDDIPLSARIFAVVDVWDALRSDRPYRNGWPEIKVLDYVREQSGQHFDPDVVEAFFNLHAEIAKAAASDVNK